MENPVTSYPEIKDNFCEKSFNNILAYVTFKIPELSRRGVDVPEVWTIVFCSGYCPVTRNNKKIVPIFKFESRKTPERCLVPKRCFDWDFSDRVNTWQEVFKTDKGDFFGIDICSVYIGTKLSCKREGEDLCASDVVEKLMKDCYFLFHGFVDSTLFTFPVNVNVCIKNIQNNLGSCIFSFLFIL